jgi:hypothetical protein
MNDLFEVIGDVILLLLAIVVLLSVFGWLV